MTARFISPDQNDLSMLRTPLEPGEQLVFEFFNKHLPPEWEIYVQPHLNGLRPDFVLLHPKVGVAVFEVKDWNLKAMRYEVDYSSDGVPILKATRNSRSFSLQDRNPIEQIHYYKEELSQLYCPRLNNRGSFVVITAGVIFPYADDEEVQSLFRPFREYRGMLKYKLYYPLVGRNSLESGNLEAVFPEALRPSSKLMTLDAAADLRHWLIEPDVAAKQRRPLKLNDKQREIATTRTKEGYRRIKGPAGSGKSLALAARAAELATTGKDVLVVTFNITLMHYLRDLAVRWRTPGRIRINSITWLNFHALCRRICFEAGEQHTYDSLWKQSPAESKQFENLRRNDIAILEGKLPALAEKLLKEDKNQRITRYDAVIVDEGQDFLPQWWQVLRNLCREGGEMLLAADTTQDIYGKSKRWPKGAWTDQPMENTGFRGPGLKLQTSYRMPPLLTHKATKFAQCFLPQEMVEVPDIPPLDQYLFPCNLRWVQTTKESALEIFVDEIIRLAISVEPEIISMADITFLVPERAFGMAVVDRLSDKGISVAHTFALDERQGRRQKLSFYMGDARIKGTTIHSFKGWEARAIALYTGSYDNERSRFLTYVGMTRLKRHDTISSLTVVSALPAFMNYGKTWPDFVRIG